MAIKTREHTRIKDQKPSGPTIEQYINIIKTYFDDEDKAYDLMRSYFAPKPMKTDWEVSEELELFFSEQCLEYQVRNMKNIPHTIDCLKRDLDTLRSSQ